MKTKKLIIDIPEEEYNSLKGIKYYIPERRSGKRSTAICLNAIANGIPLEDELEKIKTELEYRVSTQTIVEDSVGMAYWKGKRRIIFEYDALKIIDKHISELKGE